MIAGDLASAREFLELARRYDSKTRDTALNLIECLGHSGRLGAAQALAARSWEDAEADGDRTGVADAQAFLGWMSGLSGDTAGAEEERFSAADAIEVAENPGAMHMYSLCGT